MAPALLFCLMLPVVPGFGFMLQESKVLAVEFEKQSPVPEFYMQKIKSILEQKEHVVWHPFVLWDTQKRFGLARDYLEEEGISYIIEGKIKFEGENKPNKIEIVLLDSLQHSMQNYSVNFRDFEEMANTLDEVIEDLFYFIKHKKSRRKVFIVKFRLDEEIESGDKEEVELTVPKWIEFKLLNDDQLKTAFYFEYTKQEYEEWMSTNDDTNILKGAFQPFAKIQPATRDTVYYYKIDVEIIFFQTQEGSIGISIPEIPKSANYRDRLAGAIVQKLKEMVSEQEVEL